ncbi:hypothetical protein B0T25DRAFT_563341 [Lasiosphaeria hispida]|uniref:2EXR domain-containing protein n=1 Tax=Lasiosphaeria hispida TaxID=260671 RepID=A0AAJ0HWR2_9PEZI|nr:hypothetical protein B0T25DRAFT_563341 [Lasiosphaeria hispida]
MNTTGNDGTSSDGTPANGGTPATHFNLFSRLPAELRLMIWTEALPSRLVSADRFQSVIGGMLSGGDGGHNEELTSIHCSGGIYARNRRSPVIAGGFHLLYTMPFRFPLGVADMFVDLLIRLHQFEEVSMVTYHLTIHASDSFIDEHSHSLFGADFRQCPQQLADSQCRRPEPDIRKELQQTQFLFLILEAGLKVMRLDKPSTAWETETGPEYSWDADSLLARFKTARAVDDASLATAQDMLGWIWPWPTPAARQRRPENAPPELKHIARTDGPPGTRSGWRRTVFCTMVCNIKAR